MGWRVWGKKCAGATVGGWSGAKLSLITVFANVCMSHKKVECVAAYFREDIPPGV